MDSSIYLDNIRGFSRCLVRLSRVTFLVGENSSGKSSFLALAHLLLSEDFWANPDFNSLGHELGSFDDLVSKTSRYRSEFTLGCASRKNSQTKDIFGAVVSLGKKEGSPRVMRCTYLHGTRAVSYFRVASGFRWIDHGQVDMLANDFESDKVLKYLTDLHGKIRSNSGRAAPKMAMSDRYLTVVMPHAISRLLESDFGEVQDSALGFIPNDGLRGGAWFAPIRAEPRRIYEKPTEMGFSPEGVHTPYLLRNVIRKRKKDGFEKSAWEMISTFGSNSGLFNDLDIESFGRGASAPFTLSVKLGGGSFHLGEVGYGISQILPIVAEMFAGGKSLNYFMQQPEVHLHPRAQAEIANVIYIFSTSIDDSLLMVETHSDYLIERFRSLIREDYMESAKDAEAAIAWFERRDGINNVHILSIDGQGDIPSDLPDGYREFFLQETMRGLGLDADN